MTAPWEESLERIAAALERLIALEERKLQTGVKVLGIAKRQQRELEGTPNVELVESDPEPA